MWRYCNCDEMDLYSRYLSVGLYDHANSQIDTQGGRSLRLSHTS